MPVSSLKEMYSSACRVADPTWLTLNSGGSLEAVPSVGLFFQLRANRICSSDQESFNPQDGFVSSDADLGWKSC